MERKEIAPKGKQKEAISKEQLLQEYAEQKQAGYYRVGESMIPSSSSIIAAAREKNISVQILEKKYDGNKVSVRVRAFFSDNPSRFVDEWIEFDLADKAKSLFLAKLKKKISDYARFDRRDAAKNCKADGLREEIYHVIYANARHFLDTEDFFVIPEADNIEAVKVGHIGEKKEIIVNFRGLIHLHYNELRRAYKGKEISEDFLILQTTRKVVEAVQNMYYQTSGE